MDFEKKIKTPRIVANAIRLVLNVNTHHYLLVFNTYSLKKAPGRGFEPLRAQDPPANWPINTGSRGRRITTLPPRHRQNQHYQPL